MLTKTAQNFPISLIRRTLNVDNVDFKISNAFILASLARIDLRQNVLFTLSYNQVAADFLQPYTKLNRKLLQTKLIKRC